MAKPDAQTQATLRASQTARPVSTSAPTSSPIYRKGTTLYGRIEQIASAKSVPFPQLKALSPKLDERGTGVLKGNASELTLSTGIVSQFPQDYSGTWGGTLQIWTFQQDPIVFQIDRTKAEYNRLALRPGSSGAVNFIFAKDTRGEMTLEPAQVLFQVPMKDTYQNGQINQMIGQMGGANGGNNGMGQMMSSLAQSMNVPVMLQLGNFETSGLLKGVDGSEASARLVKNEIRQLQPGILEQQIVTEKTERNAKTNAIEKGYDETVIRFTKQSADQFYVQAATVAYTDTKRFKDKLILYGTVRKGQVAQNNPTVMPGLGDISKFLGPGAAGAGAGAPGQIPNIPNMPNMQGAGNIMEQLQKLLQSQ